MKFIEFFDRAYVINLPSRADRRQEMEKELQDAGMPFTPGKVELFTAIRPESRGEFESIGYRGAFLSHLNVLKKAKAEGLKNVLIMEDDLELRKDFQQYEAIMLKELVENDWDIVHFGYYLNGFPEAEAVKDISKDISLPILQLPSAELIGTQFYAVNGKAFDELINFFEAVLQRPAGHPDGGPMSPDGILNIFKWQHPHIVRLVTVPSFGGQRSSRSDVSPQWFDHLPLVRPVAKLVRKWGITKNFKNLLKFSAFPN